MEGKDKKPGTWFGWLRRGKRAADPATVDETSEATTSPAAAKGTSAEAGANASATSSMAAAVGEKASAPPPPVAHDKLGIDGNRRAFFRSFLSPVTAATGNHTPVEEHAGVILSKNPPQAKPVLRAGANAEVLAMLGPLARGEAPGGYALQRVAIREAEIHVLFSRSVGPRREDLKSVLVSLTALESTQYQARWNTTTFRVCTAGDAPEPDLALVTERVAREVARSDRGQLWVTAAVAPRVDEEKGRASGYVNPAAAVPVPAPAAAAARAGDAAPRVPAAPLGAQSEASNDRVVTSKDQSTSRDQEAARGAHDDAPRDRDAAPNDQPEAARAEGEGGVREVIAFGGPEGTVPRGRGGPSR